MKGSQLKDKKTDTRTRAWSFLLYPESLPADWKVYLERWQTPIAISPLHDKDVYEEDSETHKAGELKKSHYHCVVWFDVKTSFKVVSELLGHLNAPIPQKCNSPYSAVRYFIHLDNKDKAQYQRSDIISINGFDIEKPFELKAKDYIRILKDVYCLINQLNLFEYYQVLDAVMATNPENIIVLTKYAFAIDKYLTSRRFAAKDKNKN